MNSKKTVLITVLASCFIGSTMAADFIAADSTKHTNLCLKGIEGNRAAMHVAVNNSGYSKQFVSRNVQCNGENIVSFIAKNGKNPDKMLKLLNQDHTEVSITDIAMNREL